MIKKILLFSVVYTSFFVTNIHSQNFSDYQALIIDSLLTKNANAIVRNEEIIINLNNTKSVLVTTKRVVTVFNKYGSNAIKAYEHYDESSSIKRIEAIIYNKFGNELSKIKKKDFKDVSTYDGFSLVTDNRVKYLEYTPTEYPYTVEFYSEVESSNTAFISPWVPVSDEKISIENSTYSVFNHTSGKWRFNEKNLEAFGVEKSKRDNEVHYSIKKVKAYTPEVYSLSSRKIFPYVRIALDEFNLEDVSGSALHWQSLGKWMYDELLTGKSDLPDATVDEVSKLLEPLTTKEQKVQRVYEYVQEKTRYISIQLGIGGWMPFSAADVDRLGYGDCKALTNYTKSLLASQGIESFYTIVYADQEKQDIDPEFAAIDGNHVILNVPNNEEDIWLECTSQTMPFNFLGDFTDDRNVLLVTPEGGRIAKTKKYTAQENVLHTKAEIKLLADKSMIASLTRVSGGLEYDWNHGIVYKDTKDQKLHYKEEWDYINDLKLVSIKHNNDKDAVKFVEELKVASSSYSKKAGSRLLISPNMFSRYTGTLPSYEDRLSPLDISRGYINTDEYIIEIPQGYYVENLPEDQEVKDKFGNYHYRLIKLNENKISFSRSLVINEGLYPKEDYEGFRSFFSEIKRIDKTKIVLKQH